MGSSKLPASEEAKRAWVAALASAVLPGWGHVYAGRRGIARRLFAVDIILAVAFLVVIAGFQLDFIKLWVTQGGLALLMVVNLVALGYRLLVTSHSYSAAPRRSIDWLGALGLVMTGLMLLAPHVALGYVLVVQEDLIDSVFGAPEPVAAAPTTTTTTTPTQSATGPPGPTSTTQPAKTTTTTPRIWDGLERLNVVLFGADAGAGRTGLRTDTTIVVSVDPQTGDIAMFSVPRDLSGAPLPEGMGVWDCNCFPDLITHLYDEAEQRPQAFPGPGEPPINALKGALGEIFGIPIHYYALVTLDGFVGLVDALGGVTIEVPNRIVDETYPHEDGSVESVVIEEGTQHLDGHLALAYARIRRHSDDFARMHRQRCVLEAVAEQSSPLEILANFGQVAEAVKTNVRTDIPQDRLVDFVDLLPKISTDRIATLRVTRDVYQSGSAPGRVYYDIERIRADAQFLINDPESAQAELGLEPLETICSG